MNEMKCIVTVVGKDKVGIIARVCTYLADNEVNILDISQTIVHGYFNMMMIVEFGDKSSGFQTVADGLDVLGGQIGVSIQIQREDIFNSMHRL